MAFNWRGGEGRGDPGRRLYAAAVAQARQPGFYAALGAPDTPAGRFELYTLHVVLLLRRLRGEAPRIAQSLFDAYLRGLDDALRDLGVGDLSVGKKMRRLGEAFYGRAKNYDEALGAEDGGAALTAMLSRTALVEAPEGAAAQLSAYALAAAAALEAAPLEPILAGDLPWPALPASPQTAAAA